MCKQYNCISAYELLTANPSAQSQFFLIKFLVFIHIEFQLQVLLGTS